MNRLGGSIIEPSVTEIMAKKEKFSPDVEKAINLLHIGGESVILGSYTLKSTLYPSDIDIYNTVTGMKLIDIKKRFKELVNNIQQQPDTWLIDIKLGTDDAMKIIDESAYMLNGKLYRYNQQRSLQKLRGIKDNIDPTDFLLGRKLLVARPTEQELDLINKELRFHLLRWSSNDVKKGYKILANGKKYNLVTGFKSDALFKVDIIRLINNKYIEITIIYNLRSGKNNRRLGGPNISVEDQLKDDIRKQLLKKQYYKVLKRQYSLVKYQYKYNKNTITQRVTLANHIQRINKILNSDLGRLYQVKVMVDVLNSLIESYKNIPPEKVLRSISGMVGNLNNISTIDLDKNHGSIINLFTSILKLQKTKNMALKLEDIETRLSTVLDSQAKQYVKKL